MSLPMTNHTLEKLEQLFAASGYKIRYEKGNFKSGSCVLEHSKVVVINRFSNLEGKIQAMVNLLRRGETDLSVLDEKQKQFYLSLTQSELF
ncbi:hypothetical protein C7T94_13130 [Pedobacter yulinensis]|uniref:Uncharacterized protein n=1 Tax=Pedobacter yulinensis TaxID=2126353 RepID=A0A2T3HN81_9SPHI|nr:hypothetical protein [Pedobacter yulinensis]PST83853.1 hypothetical protein C7T94_13130 [Pedobacter yulinensis]